MDYAIRIKCEVKLSCSCCSKGRAWVPATVDINREIDSVPGDIYQKPVFEHPPGWVRHGWGWACPACASK